jgi:hemoglobin
MSAGSIPLAQPRAAISKEAIRLLVQAFYDRVLRDEVLGPVFQVRLGHRWDEHVATMVDFWSSVALATGRYGGKPHLAHRGLDLDPDPFGRWLSLFEATAHEACGEAAPFLTNRAHRIADSLMIGLGIGPKAVSLTPAVEARS